MEPLSYEGFKTLALASKRAFHLEQRDAYNVAAEDEPFGRWLRGEPDDYAWHQDWLNSCGGPRPRVLPCSGCG